MVVIKTDFEIRKIRFMLFLIAGNEFLGLDVVVSRSKHDGCSVRVIRTDKVAFVAIHALKSNPNIGLDVFHHVAQMNWPIGIGKCACHQNFSLHFDSLEYCAQSVRRQFAVCYNNRTDPI